MSSASTGGLQGSSAKGEASVGRGVDAVEKVNIFSSFEGRLDVAQAVGSDATAMFVYDIAPGRASSPYHYEYAEEWLTSAQATPVRASAIAAGAAVGVALAAQVRLQILEPGITDSLPVPLEIARDASLALAVAFPIALLAGRPRRFRGAVLVRVGAAALALVGLAAAAGAATGGGGAGGVCPTGAPVRHFDVVSLDVDITLNRFKDHDPLGQMYTLKDNVAAVRAQDRRAG